MHDWNACTFHLTTPKALGKSSLTALPSHLMYPPPKRPSSSELVSHVWWPWGQTVWPNGSSTAHPTATLSGNGLEKSDLSRTKPLTRLIVVSWATGDLRRRVQRRVIRCLTVSSWHLDQLCLRSVSGVYVWSSDLSSKLG